MVEREEALRWMSAEDTVDIVWVTCGLPPVDEVEVVAFEELRVGTGPAEEAGCCACC